MVVPADAIVNQDEHLVAIAFIPMLGVDSLDLHTTEEALRGRPSQEFFHRRSFAGVSMDGFVGMLDDYMVWYRDRRIKTEFGMSIMDRRRRLGLVA